MSVKTVVTATAHCDVKRCRECVTWSADPDVLHGEPEVPPGWTTRLPPKHAVYQTVCPHHSRPNAICGKGLGTRPGWMGVDQWDPCPCDQPMNHDGDCSCSHTRSEA